MAVWTFVLCTIFSQATFAISHNSLYVGLGLYSHALTKTTQTSSGDTSLLGPMYYPLTLQTSWSIGQYWSISPQLGYTILPRTAPDGGSKMSYLYLNLPFIKNSSPDFDWGLGPGFWLYNIQGSGGTTQLNNGGGTSTFSLPSGTKGAKTISFNLGLGINSKNFRFTMDLITESLLSNSRRTFSLMLGFNYNFLGNGY